ncbi:MAG: RNA polymerase sigma factor [Myxococcales bacterium]|nr:RNA polymerase sigma factor [Myxococcales bacterium]
MSGVDSHGAQRSVDVASSSRAARARASRVQGAVGGSYLRSTQSIDASLPSRGPSPQDRAPQVAAPALSAELRESWKYLVALARRFGRGGLDPEDLAQDVFERWLRAAPGLAPSIRPRAWMTVVLRNLAIDRVRRRRAAPELLADCARVPANDGEAAPWWRELNLVEVSAALEELPPALRTTFVLFEVEDKTYDQIAQELQISKSTVGVRVLRARRRLKALLSARRAC